MLATESIPESGAHCPVTFGFYLVLCLQGGNRAVMWIRWVTLSSVEVDLVIICTIQTVVHVRA